MINLFASGLSVLDLNLHEIKDSGLVVTTNYPVSLIDEYCTSDIHAFGDIDTAQWVNEYFKNKPVALMTRDLIYDNYRKHIPDVSITHVIKSSLYEPWYETTFLLTLQAIIGMYANDSIRVYGLDFEVGKEYARWYDKYVQEKDSRGNKKFTPESYNFRLNIREKCNGYATENFRKTFELFYAAKKNILSRVEFCGKWHPS